MSHHAGKSSPDTPDPLSFFGRISASLSHEMNNMLAVINENAGIIKDISSLLNEIDPSMGEKMDIYCDRILNHTKRGAGLVKHFNRFTHSMDEADSEIDVKNQLMAISALCGRFASMKNISIENPVVAGNPVISGKAFDFLYLVFYCIDYLIESSDAGGKILVSAEDKRNPVEISISGGPAEWDSKCELILERVVVYVKPLDGNASLDYDKSSRQQRFLLKF